MKSLQDAGVDQQAIEHLDRYMVVRQNILTAAWLDLGPISAPGFRKAMLPALEATASAARRADSAPSGVRAPRRIQVCPKDGNTRLRLFPQVEWRRSGD